jgi:homoserine kinase
MANTSVLIRVPATVGNFAGAMNCAALALDASLNVKVTPRTDGRMGIRYFGENGDRVPRDRSNLIVRALQAALHLRGLEFTGADCEVYSSVPVGVGLGSSTAAVLAGLMAADRLFRLGLDEKTLFELAAIYESRNDNLRAAWAGGFVARLPFAGEASEQPAASLPAQAGCRRTMVPENFVLSVVVPESALAVGERRPRPAERIAGKNLAAHQQRAAGLAEFFARAGNGASLDLESPLPPTCEKAVAGLDEALQVRTPGLSSVFVCGSGPAVGILAQEDAAGAVRAVRECFARRGVETTTTQIRPTNRGAREWNAVHPDVTLPAARPLGVPREESSLIVV